MKSVVVVAVAVGGLQANVHYCGARRVCALVNMHTNVQFFLWLFFFIVVVYRVKHGGIYGNMFQHFLMSFICVCIYNGGTLRVKRGLCVCVWKKLLRIVAD